MHDYVSRLILFLAFSNAVRNCLNMLSIVTAISTNVMYVSNDAVINHAHLFWPDLFVELLKKNQFVIDYIKNYTSYK